ncbi:MAG: MFS transporter [Actinomycetota bacterium]|nr:MFS transporter [Actinomycetota bacterium]
MSATPGSPAAESPPGADIGARLDRLKWSPVHNAILLALGAGWLFDAFEVQLFGNAIGPLGDYFHASFLQRDAVQAVWLAGILLGALAGGRLADRFGRRRLFMLTLLWYAGFTFLTALSPTLVLVYAFRALAALGVGAEYSIVNSAIAEFVPARVRGRANAFVMNFWPAGAIVAALLAFVVLNLLTVSNAMSWRYIFAFGGVIALVVLFFRRHLPESPRWLVSRGRLDEAEAIVASLEAASGGGRRGRPAGAPIERSAPSFPQAIRELVAKYPGRLALGCSLDLAEAFGYYGIFAVLSVVVLKQVHVSNVQIPFFYIVGNVGGLAGGIAMSANIERLGRKRTVIGFYAAAAVGVGLLAIATSTGSAVLVTGAFVISNAAATGAWTSAYPTFTELFPTHLRGAGVGTSVAVGRIGAIVGTLALPSIAAQIGAAFSYLLVGLFWAVGVMAMAIYSRSGGKEASGLSLEQLVPDRNAGKMELAGRAN